MKTRLLMIVGILLSLWLSGIAFATHDPAYNHPTPITSPESELPPCTSTRDACQNPPICENTIWDCSDNSDVFSNVIESEDDMGISSIDLDPELSPSYSQEFIQYTLPMPIIFPVIIIVTLFVGTFVVLKIKKTPSRPYLALVLTGLLLFFGIPNFVSSLEFMPYLISQPEQIRPYVFEQIFLAMWVPTIALSIAGILLYRSSVIRKMIKK